MRKSNNFVRLIIVAITIISLLVMTGCKKEEATNKGDITDPYKVEETNPRHRDGVGNIAWLENANDSDYPEIKEWIKNYIYENTEIEPEKVAFSYICMYQNNYHPYFSCYYKKAGDWYEFDLNETEDSILEHIWNYYDNGVYTFSGFYPIWKHPIIENCETLSEATYKEHPILAEKLTQKLNNPEAVGIEIYPYGIYVCYKCNNIPLWYGSNILFEGENNNPNYEALIDKALDSITAY